MGKKVELSAEQKDLIEKASARIKEALRRDGGYSHNIISFTLSHVAKDCGTREANKLITKHRLERLGWVKEPEDGQSNRKTR